MFVVDSTGGEPRQARSMRGAQGALRDDPRDASRSGRLATGQIGSIRNDNGAKSAAPRVRARFDRTPGVRSEAGRLSQIPGTLRRRARAPHLRLPDALAQQPGSLASLKGHSCGYQRLLHGQRRDGVQDYSLRLQSRRHARSAGVSRANRCWATRQVRGAHGPMPSNVLFSLARSAVDSTSADSAFASRGAMARSAHWPRQGVAQRVRRRTVVQQCASRLDHLLERSRNPPPCSEHSRHGRQPRDDEDAVDVEKNPSAAYIEVRGANHDSVVTPSARNGALIPGSVCWRSGA